MIWVGMTLVTGHLGGGVEVRRIGRRVHAGVTDDRGEQQRDNRQKYDTAPTPTLGVADYWGIPV
jgi:hypothetical protein